MVKIFATALVFLLNSVSKWKWQLSFKKEAIWIALVGLFVHVDIKYWDFLTLEGTFITPTFRVGVMKVPSVSLILSIGGTIPGLTTNFHSILAPNLNSFDLLQFHRRLCIQIIMSDLFSSISSSGSFLKQETEIYETRSIIFSVKQHHSFYHPL